MFAHEYNEFLLRVLPVTVGTWVIRRIFEAACLADGCSVTTIWIGKYVAWGLMTLFICVEIWGLKRRLNA